MLLQSFIYCYVKSPHLKLLFMFQRTILLCKLETKLQKIEVGNISVKIHVSMFKYLLPVFIISILSIKDGELQRA